MSSVPTSSPYLSSIPAFVSSGKRLAKKACNNANADLKAASTRRLEDPKVIKKLFRGKGPKDEADLYHWDKGVSDWKDKGFRINS